jgi:hypothetical protein
MIYILLRYTAIDKKNIFYETLIFESLSLSAYTNYEGLQQEVFLSYSSLVLQASF